MRKDIWLISRMDQAVLAAEHLANKGRLARWDSFSRFRRQYFFLKIPQKRVVTEALKTVPGVHFLPEVVGRLFRPISPNLSGLLQDKVLAFLACIGTPLEYEILHGQGNYSLESARRAKKQGKIFISEISGQLGNVRAKQLKAVYEEFGKKLYVGIPALQRRREEEARIADYIICPSVSVHEELVREGFAKEKIFIVEYESPILKELIFLPRKNTEVFRILYVGNISISKGIHTLVRACKSLVSNGKTVEVVLVGPLLDREILKEANGADFIYFKGKLTGQALFNEYQKATIFVMPSFSEGSSLVTYEAMAAGVPLIASTAAGSLVEDGVSGFLFPPHCTDCLEHLILKMLEDPSVLSRFSDEGRSKIKSLMKVSYGERLELVYNKILGYRQE